MIESVNQSLKGLIDLAVNYILSHLKLTILIGTIVFLILIIILIVGNYMPTYSFWHRFADKLDEIANLGLTIIGIIGFCELLMVTYVLTQLFKYGGG